MPTDLDNNSKSSRAPTARFLESLENYIADGHKSDVLYEHQKAIINDTAAFLRAGNLRGYIDAPTGTGKTVLFVTLAEAFNYQSETPPKILVVTPTKDLVRQTVGGSGGDKGFAGFAPHMSVGTFYSDTRSTMRGLESQVTITTYASLSKLANSPVAITDESGKRTIKYVNRINEEFDIIFLDEGHKALGTSSQKTIETISADMLIIGFTATPDYHPTRSLSNLLPTLIHRLDLKEAITLHMLSPVTPIALPAPVSIERQFILSALGEYESSSLKQLIYDEARNGAVVELAARLIATDNTPIIACIPGDDMAHPTIIADLLAQKTIEDSSGIPRPIEVRAVTSSISAAARQAIYAELEQGTIDALTYIDVLTEGWDSQRVNVIINARPTRSLVAARQRMGRILRNKADNRPAFAIDIVDKLKEGTAPQVSMADIFTSDSLENGSPIGEIDQKHRPNTKQIVENLLRTYKAPETIANHYTKYIELLESLPHLTRGQAHITRNGKVRTFASPSRLFTRLGVDSFAIKHLIKLFDIDTRQVRRHHEAIDAYDEEQVQASIVKLPNAVHTGMGLRIGDTSYISLNELIAIIQRKYSFVDVSYKGVESYAHEVVSSDKELYFTRRFRARTHRGLELYTAQTMVSIEIGKQIAEMYRNT